MLPSPCLSIKCLFGLALRQAWSRACCATGLDYAVPGFSTLSSHQKDLQARIQVQRKQGCLYLLVDRTDIKMMGEGERKVKEHGTDYRRQWRKLYLGIDAQTLEIRAIEVTDIRTGGATMLPKLLSQIPPTEKLVTVATDGAYDTLVSCRDCESWCCGHHSSASKRPVLEREFTRQSGTQLVATLGKVSGAHTLEKVEWLPSA